jgi:hypothetical protein
LKLNASPDNAGNLREVQRCFRAFVASFSYSSRIFEVPVAFTDSAHRIQQLIASLARGKHLTVAKA